MEHTLSGQLGSEPGEERYTLRNARHLAADYIRRTVRLGDTVVDATMGNGGDTLFLAQLVGAEGCVYGFDVQEEAVANTRRKLIEAGQDRQAVLLLCGHEHMREHVSRPPQAVMFNLGWLPGAAHAVTTRVETTLAAVSAAVQMIVPGGVVSICIYPGHEEGTRELHSLLDYASGLDVRRYNVLHHHFLCAPAHTPQLILIQRNK